MAGGHWWVLVADPSRGKKALLFEKRSKNFCLFGVAPGSAKPFKSKSFLVLFYKKERFLPGRAIIAPRPAAPDQMSA
jgi:hypothetical protein